MTHSTTIDFCIPAIGAGAHYLDYLISNLYRTASNPERIRVMVSYHNEEDREQLAAAKYAAQIQEFVKIPAYSDVLFAASANHSAAINGLACRCASDIAIFCDYDMAFLMPGWDKVIADRLFERGCDLIGVQYSNLVLTAKFDKSSALGWLSGVPLVKYQRMPNLSFLAMRRELLTSCFAGGKVTAFDRYLVEGGLPFRIINSPAMARETQIPMGTIQWLDTGYEIPGLIAQHQLKYETLLYRGLSDQAVFPVKEPFSLLGTIQQPEFFYLDNAPFLCHFKKGSLKSKNGAENNSLFELFIANIELFLANSAAENSQKIA